MDWIAAHWFELGTLALLTLIAFLQWLGLDNDKTWREIGFPLMLLKTLNGANEEIMREMRDATDSLESHLEKLDDTLKSGTREITDAVESVQAKLEEASDRAPSRDASEETPRWRQRGRLPG